MLFSSTAVDGGNSIQEDRKKSELNDGSQTKAGQPNAKEVAQADLSSSSNVDSDSKADDIVSVICRLMGKREFQAFILFWLSIYKEVIDGAESIDELLQLKKGKRLLFVAFLTRRCHVLKEIFYVVLKSDQFKNQVQNGEIDLSAVGLKPEQIEDSMIDFVYNNFFITDFNLLSMSRGFAQYYFYNRTLPEVIVADELLLHGRAVNQLLFKMEDAVSRHFCELKKQEMAGSVPEQEMALEQWGERIRTEFQNSVHILVFARKNGTLLLFSRYAQEGRFSALEYDLKRWRSLSLCFARIVSSSTFNNVGFSWSLCPQVSAFPFLTERYNATEPYWQPEEAEKLPLLLFRRVATHMQDICLQHYLRLYATDGTLKAILSVRIKKSLSKSNGIQKLMIVPYLMMGKVPNENVWALFKRLRSDVLSACGDQNLRGFLNILPDDPEINPQDEAQEGLAWNMETVALFDYDRICGINNLFLNCLLIKNFWPSIGENWNWLKEAVDWQQLNSNYRRFDPETGELQDQRKALEAIWSWNPTATLEDYLETLFSNVKGLDLQDYTMELSEQSEQEQNLEESLLEKCVLNVVSQLGLGAETNAHERLTSDVTFDEKLLISWGNNRSILEVVSMCREQCVQMGMKKPDIYKVVAEIIQAMDLGIIGMNTALDSPKSSYTLVKAGEQALFVKPIRYRNFIPLFSEIERKYSGDRGAILREIRYFAENNSEYILEKDNSLFCGCSGNAEEDAKKMTKELVSFVEELYHSGQTISDWDISLSEQLDKDNFSFMSQLIKDIDLQNKYLQLYHQQ